MAAPAIAQALGDLVEGAQAVGLDMAQIPQAFYEALEGQLSGIKCVDCSPMLRDLRMVKTEAEQELLEEVAYRADHGINGAIHHVIVKGHKTQLTLAEEILVHCMERFLELRGYQSAAQVACGRYARSFWPVSPRFGYSSLDALEQDELVRMSIRTCKDNYWTDATRMMNMGPTSAEQAAAYDRLVALREMMLTHLRPGTRCCDVFQKVTEEAATQGIPFVVELGLGHGVGVRPFEPPFLNGGDETVLQPGMVLVLDPVVHGPGGEIMRSKDTVIITETGQPPGGLVQGLARALYPHRGHLRKVVMARYLVTRRGFGGHAASALPGRVPADAQIPGGPFDLEGGRSRASRCRKPCGRRSSKA